MFDLPVIHRCQLHNVRNVESNLPKALASTVAKKMRAAYHDPAALAAEATLEALARSLEKKHPGAAGSLPEGLLETVTVRRLGVPPTLARTLRSTNAIESMIRSAGTERSAMWPSRQRFTLVESVRGPDGRGVRWRELGLITP